MALFTQFVVHWLAASAMLLGGWWVFAAVAGRPLMPIQVVAAVMSWPLLLVTVLVPGALFLAVRAEWRRRRARAAAPTIPPARVRRL